MQKKNWFSFFQRITCTLGNYQGSSFNKTHYFTYYFIAQLVVSNKVILLIGEFVFSLMKVKIIEYLFHKNEHKIDYEEA